MSRIGKQPVTIPAGVEATLSGRTLTVKGAKGEDSYNVPDVVDVKVEDGQVVVTPSSNSKQSRAMHGTVRSLVANMVEGVLNGYTKELQLEGVGFRAEPKGQVLVLALGYSHPIEFKIPDGVTITVNQNTEITITGVSKQLVGQSAAQIRSYYPAEPYKGKGVRYKGEQIRRKAGKAVA